MFSFFNKYCDKIAQGIINETSQKIAETVTVGIKSDAVKTAKITANGAQLAAKITARGAKIAAALQVLAALSVGGAAAYATYNYMHLVKDELARGKKEEKELDQKVEEIRAKQEKQTKELLRKYSTELKSENIKVI